MGYTSYERVMTAMALKEPDRIPVMPRVRGVSIRYAGLKGRECFDNPDKYIAAQVRMVEDFAFDAVTDLLSGAPLFNEFFGAELQFQETTTSAAPVFTSAEEFRKAKTIDLTKIKRMEDVYKTIRKLKGEVGRDFPVVVSVPTAFRSAALLRGVEEFYVDMVMNPLFVRDLLSFCLDMCKAFAEIVIDAGADIIFTSSSVANRDCISRKHYEEFVTDDEKGLHAFLTSKNLKIIHHTCGDWSDRFDLAVAEGPDALFVSVEADIGELKQTYGDRVCIMGNVDSVGVMLRGTADEVEKKALECIKKAGKYGGFILSGDCELPPGTPVENLRAMERVGKTFGVYPLKFEEEVLI